MKNKLFLTLAAAILMMASCVTEQGQRSKAEKFYRQHPGELSEKCAATYPPVYKQGKTITLPGDTVYVKGDSVKCPDVINAKGEKTEGVKIKCPDGRTVYIPTLRVDTVESTAALARIDQLRGDLANKTAEAKQSKQELKEALKTAKIRLFILIGLILLAVGGIALKTYLKK